MVDFVFIVLSIATMWYGIIMLFIVTTYAPALIILGATPILLLLILVGLYAFIQGIKE